MADFAFSNKKAHPITEAVAAYYGKEAKKAGYDTKNQIVSANEHQQVNQIVFSKDGKSVSPGHIVHGTVREGGKDRAFVYSAYPPTDMTGKGHMTKALAQAKDKGADDTLLVSRPQKAKKWDDLAHKAGYTGIKKR